jgi:hypothetical protein
VPPRRIGGRHPVPIGPAVNVDWEHPFWAAGFARCSRCGETISARVEIRERKFHAARPTMETLDVLAWGH